MANKTDERLLDSFAEASGRGSSGPNDLPGIAEGIAGAMKDAISAETAAGAGGASPPASRGQAGTAVDAPATAIPADAGAATAQELAKEMWGALTTAMAPDEGGVAAAAQEPVKATWDALTTGTTPEAAGATAAAAQGQAGGGLYGESETAAGLNVHSSSSSTGTASGGSSTGAKVESMATSYFEGGGIISLIGGLIGLFSGGASAPPALEKYAMPSSISFESAETGSGLSASDFDQMGAPRPYSSAAESPIVASGGTVADPGVGGQSGGSLRGGGNAAAPQISVTVQTMDAQSFLDNSDQIARAVRGAMLNLSSINDIVNEL